MWWWYLPLFYIALVALLAAGWRWGEWPEKAGAALYAVATIVSLLSLPGAATEYHHVEIGVAVVDLSLLIGLTVIALRANRWWPICASALQLIAITAHLAKALNPDLSRLAYGLMIGILSYVALINLAVGLWSVCRNARRHASDISVASSKEEPHPTQN